MNLKKNKVSLRLLTIEDAYISFEWRNNPKIWEFTLNSPTKIIDIEDANEDKCWISLYHRVNAIRPIPYFSNPSLT